MYVVIPLSDYPLQNLLRHLYCPLMYGSRLDGQYHWDRYPRVAADRENWNWDETEMSIGYESGKCTLAVQGGIRGCHKSAPVSHKHMLSHPSFSSPLINEDLPAGPQLVVTLNNRFFRHQACYSLLPAKPGGQADRVVSLCKYKVVGQYYYIVILGRPCITIKGEKTPKSTKQ